MPRLYKRNQGGEARFYGDFRDIGGGQHALVPDGAKRATTDEAVAQRLLALKTLELTGLPIGAPPGATPTLKDFADRFLRDNPGDVTERWLKETKLRLTRAVEFFGTDRDLASIRPKDVRRWLDQYLHLSNSNQRHHLHALSGLYRYAQELEVVPVGYNPVSGLYRKPSVVRKKQRTEDFFEIDQAARFLAKAIELDQAPEIVATFLLTGGRRSEVLGLLRGDVNFETGFVRFEPNRFRGLKRTWSERSVPLWPQLREILEPFAAGTVGEPEDLLFRTPGGLMVTDLRKPLGIVSGALKSPTPRLTKFRHTYATARLQTTDNGQQIAVWTVAKELGHKTVARVEDTYGHPSHYRPRGEVVEYRL